MIKVKIGDSASRETIMVDETNTIRETLEDNEINYEIGLTYLDGMPVAHSDFDKTFEDLGKTEKCSLIVVVKAENA